MNISVKITREENCKHFGCKPNDIVSVDFDEYVAAVTASELASGSLEACKAQAVAARSFAVSRGVLDGKPISDQSSSAQAYRAVRADKEKFPVPYQAATDTSGEILTYNGKPASTVYSDSNGGQTVSSKTKWGGSRPYLISQPDPWNGTRNSGHGVGMSQQGAKAMAKAGHSYQEILAFYYPGTLLESIDKREETMATKPEEVIAYATAHLGNPYVFGAWGEECTPANRKKRVRSDHPTIKSKCQVLRDKDRKENCDGCKYKGGLMFDCRGFTYWCLKQVGIILSGGGATSQYNTSGNWVARGKIEEMPDVVCCVFQYDKKKGNMAHTGLYIPWEKRIIDCSTDVGYRKVTSAWTHYAVPKGLYSAEELADKKVAVISTTYPTVKRGSRGETVKKLQELLNTNGYSVGEVDGIFGANTLAAVKNFQAAHGLDSDGIVGPNTWSALSAIESRGQATYTITIRNLDQITAEALQKVYPQSTIEAQV